MISGLPLQLAAAAQAATESGNPLTDITRQFHVTGPLFFSQLASFLAVCCLLYKFAYKPVLVMLDERRNRIAAGEAKLEEIERQLAESEERTEQMIAEANQRADRLITEAKESAQTLSEQRARETDREIESRLAKASEAAQAERDQLRSELKQEFGRLITATTAKVTGKVLNNEDQHRLNEEALHTLQN